MQFVLKRGGESEGSSSPKDSKWTIERCEEYVRDNQRLPANKRKQPLHELLQGMHVEVEEQKEEPSEEYKKRIEYLRKREAQREYERMVKGLQRKDTSLHLNQELKNPMDNIQNALAAAAGAATVGIFFYYTTHKHMGEVVGMTLGVLSFALMLILETVLYMARFYLIEHKDLAQYVCFLDPNKHVNKILQYSS